MHMTGVQGIGTLMETAFMFKPWEVIVIKK